MAAATTLHFLAALLWIGGMFFALTILRPAALPLEMETRVDLWARTLTRFMPVVWGSALTLPISGYWMLFYGFGGLSGMGLHILIMQILGWSMILLFFYIYFRPFQRMRYMVNERLIPEAGLYIERIRILIQINLITGILVICVAAGGRYW